MTAGGQASTARVRARDDGEMSIGQVLRALEQDFPDVTISKIRFLEDQGLVEPDRTPSGYRKFTHAHVARLRYVLSAQRDHYLPLRVIREHLDAMDRGLEPPALPGGRPGVPRVVAVGGEVAPEAFRRTGSDLRLTRAEVAESAGADEPLMAALESYGLLAPGSGPAPYDGDDLAVATAAAELAAFGIEPRHLRAFRVAADREVGLVEQVVTPLRRQRDASSRARADEAAREISALCVRLHAALVRAALDAD